MADSSASSVPDYDAEDVLVVSEPTRIRALAHELRGKIVLRLRDRARSTTELATELGLPKGTVSHHLKVLEQAGLVRVVRTRQVRALTEKYYGRTARLFLVKSADEDAGRSFVSTGLRQAADEVLASTNRENSTFGLLHTHLREIDARRFRKRLDKLIEEFRARDDAHGIEYGLAIAMYPLERKT